MSRATGSSAKVLCLIPARGGSKGVPRKNVRAVGGRPLIEWTVSAALEASHAMDVVVSTDDQEIAALARDAGAAVPFLRPAELAEDWTTTENVVLHALDSLRTEQYQVVVLLQATSPVRLPGTIDRAVDMLVDEELDTVVGVVEASPFMWRAADPPVPDYDVQARPMRQEILPSMRPYRETGSIYVTRSEIYDLTRCRIGGRVGLLLMDPLEGIDIDTELDLMVAECTLQFLRG